MKLKSYLTDQSERRKVKYHSKTKGYSEDQDYFLYTSHQDEQEALQVTSARFTVNLDDSEHYF